jgi:hypothetical protein
MKGVGKRMVSLRTRPPLLCILPNPIFLQFQCAVVFNEGPIVFRKLVNNEPEGALEWYFYLNEINIKNPHKEGAD